MFVGTERMGLGNARHLHICHLSFLSELAPLNFGVNFKPTRTYTDRELRNRHQLLYVIVYSIVKDGLIG